MGDTSAAIQGSAMIDRLHSYRLTATVIWNLILKSNNLYLFLVLFVLTLFTLQWLFNIDQLLEIVFGDNPLSVADRLDFLVDGFVNIFRYVNDFVPVAMILISLMQAATFTLLLRYRSMKKLQGKQGVSIGLSFLGVGCVACGGSVLTPVLGVVATNVSVSLAESISTILLVIALVLSYLSMNQIAFLVAKAVPEA